jgi:hypothetical protein
MKPVDVARVEEAIAQETYRHHLAVEAEQRTQLEQLVHERDRRMWPSESESYYEALGVLLENKVRGLVREWEARPQ